MKRFLIFVFAMFAIGTAYGDDIVCPAGSYINDDGECVLCPAGTYSDSENATKCTVCKSTYPNSEPGASDVNQCYSDWQLRECSTQPGCKPGCLYRMYVKKEKKGMGYIYSDGEFKDGCSECPASPVALAGYHVDGDKCELCPAGTYSTGGENAQCIQCPKNKSASMPGTISVDGCGRILNYRAPNADTPTQIFLGTIKNTSPALAVGIGNDIFYANMTPVNNQISGNMYVGYNNKTYKVGDNTVRNRPDRFYITIVPDTYSFDFYTIVSGNFTVDWGDGNVETLNYDTCARRHLSHTYNVTGAYTITLTGNATGYCKAKVGMATLYKAISFSDTSKIAKIDGSLGAVFPTLPGGTNPNFYGLFSGATNLTGQIPEMLFDGIYGSPSASIYKGMFNSVFYGCSGLVGQIPVGLFGDLFGDPGTDTFVNAFSGCGGLTGPAAINADDVPLYDIKYGGQTWLEYAPDAFTDMYTDSGISDL